MYISKIWLILLAILLGGTPLSEMLSEPQDGSEITAPIHSPLYIDGVAVEDVITYFNEVCLDSEITLSGDPSVVQKWTAPISYYLHGDYTEEDKQTVEGFAAWLNTVEGFPGIEEISYSAGAVMNIYFCSQDELVDRMGDEYSYSDGAVTFWYEQNEIYTAIICCRDDVSQHLRNSVILEEIYNSLGPVQDTMLREDSLIYQYYSEPQALTAVDELIIRLLYHPDIECGMNAADCEAVIRTLYY